MQEFVSVFVHTSIRWENFLEKIISATCRDPPLLLARSLDLGFLERERKGILEGKWENLREMREKREREGNERWVRWRLVWDERSLFYCFVSERKVPKCPHWLGMNYDKYMGYLVFLGEIGIFSCGNPSYYF